MSIERSFYKTWQFMPPEGDNNIFFIKGKINKAWRPPLEINETKDVRDFYQIYIDFYYFIKNVSYKEDIKYDLHKVFIEHIYIREVVGGEYTMVDIENDSFCGKYAIDLNNIINCLPKKDRYFTISDCVEWAWIE